MKSALSSGQHPHLPSSIPSIRWEDVIASALLLLLIAAFFWRTLSGDVFQPADGGDLASFLYPTYRFAAASLAHGELPLWNPTLYGGAPFIADIQAGFLYLPNVLLFLLNPNFGYEWMQWLAIGHLLGNDDLAGDLAELEIVKLVTVKGRLCTRPGAAAYGRSGPGLGPNQSRHAAGGRRG